MLTAICTILWFSDRRQYTLDRRLLDAVRRGESSAVERAIREGARVEARADGVYSIADDDARTVTFVERARRYFGYTPHNLGPTALIYAVEINDRELVDVLIHHGADVNARDATGTALKHAQDQYAREATAASRGIVEQLKQSGAREQ